MEVWRANMGIQLILDAGKVTEYMTKYVTKPESDASFLQKHDQIYYAKSAGQWQQCSIYNETCNV
eukprot:118670-Ditylum_brightwellii.AAC.1